MAITNFDTGPAMTACGRGCGHAGTHADGAEFRVNCDGSSRHYVLVDGVAVCPSCRSDDERALACQCDSPACAAKRDAIARD